MKLFSNYPQSLHYVKSFEKNYILSVIKSQTGESAHENNELT